METEFLHSLCRLAEKAGAAIVEDKARTSTIEFKADASPVTSADLAAHQVIMSGLKTLAPSIPVMSEEAATLPYEERKKWSSYFLVDPLDGTKEFIKGRKEYTVNIALIVDGVPEAGVVFVPELNQTFFGAKALGSFKQEGSENAVPIRVAESSGDTPIVVGSSSHVSEEMASFLKQLGSHQLLQFGSSLKICQVADGTAHIYPRFGLTSEWDTAAGHAVVLHAGGEVVTLKGEALSYNQKESVLNPHFFVLGPKDRNWLKFAAAAYDK